MISQLVTWGKMRSLSAYLRTIGILLLLAWNIQAQILSDEFVQGVLRQSDVGDEYTDPKPCSAGQLTVCVGCKKIKVCIGAANDTDNPTQFCPTEKQYCNSEEGEVCSTVPDSRNECENSVEPFTCTATGTFPDPYSCDGYYYCENIGGIGDLYKCPQDYIYNSQVELCQRSGSGACPTVNCTGINSIFTPYPRNPKYFFYCKSDPNDSTAPPKPIMFSCGNGALFDVRVGKCIFRCPREGLFAKEGSPASYYQCYFSGGRLVAKEKQCPGSNQKFDDKKMRGCVKIE